MFTNFLVIFNCFIQILFSAMVLRIFIQNISFQSHKRRVEEVINKWQLRTMSTIVNNSFFSLFFRSFKLWKVLNKEKKVHIPGFSKETQQQNALNTGEFFFILPKERRSNASRCRYHTQLNTDSKIPIEVHRHKQMHTNNMFVLSAMHSLSCFFHFLVSIKSTHCWRASTNSWNK